MPSKIRHYLTAFIAGELDPLLGARVDSEHYNYGLALCENFLPVNEGPLVKRPGFEFIREADETSAWLGAFRFSVTQEYLIEWGEEKARFFTNGGRIESDPETPYELVTPYAAADVAMLSAYQSYDRLYLAHPDYPPAALARTSATTFDHEVSELLNGPFADGNGDEAAVLTVTGTLSVGGAVTLTGDLGFAAGHVGSLLKIEAEDYSSIKAWEPQMEGVLLNSYCRSDGKVYQCSDAGSGITGTYQPTHASGAEWDGLGLPDVAANGPYGVQWTYVHDLLGIVEITSVTNPTTAAGEVRRRLPATASPMTTWRWAHGYFSAEAGWPSLVFLWNGRLGHIKDFDIVASVVGDFGGGRVNYSTHDEGGGLTSDLAFRRTLQGSDPPLWVTVDRRLILGTATREITIGPVNPQLAVSGENISAEPQSYYGSEQVWPVQAGTETIFVQRGGRRIRGADYDFARDRYDAPDMTATARHITLGGVIQLAQQRVPFPAVYAVRGDGQLLAHPKTRTEIKGWSRFVLGGGATALSAATIVGADGRTDELWLLVERETPAGTRREIWKQSAWRELGDDRKAAFFVDGGATGTIAAGETEISGLEHLAGQAVAVLCNGGVVTGLSVSGAGVLTLPAEAVPAYDYTLTVGLAYTARAVSLRPAAQFRGMWIHGLLQRVVKGVVRLLDTAGLLLGVPGGGEEELVGRNPQNAMDEPVPLFSGDSDGLVDAEFERNGQLSWTSSDPLPAVVLGAMLNIDVDGEDV